MSATKRLSAISMQDKLDTLAADVTAPVPDMNLARLLAGIFNVLGLGFILLGAVALYLAFQPQAATASSAAGGSNSTISTLLGGDRSALVLASLIGIVGGASNMLIGATVNMIADIRVDMAHQRRLLAGLLETNLRPYHLNQKEAPQPLVIHMAPTLSPEVAAAKTETLPHPVQQTE